MSSNEISSRIEMSVGYGRASLAGSRLTMVVFLKQHRNGQNRSEQEIECLHISELFQNVFLQGLNSMTDRPYLSMPLRNWYIPLQYVVLPDPGGPITTCGGERWQNIMKNEHDAFCESFVEEDAIGASRSCTCANGIFLLLCPALVRRYPWCAPEVIYVDCDAIQCNDLADGMAKNDSLFDSCTFFLFFFSYQHLT